MSRIEKVFRNKNYRALMPYVTIGYPSIEATVDIVSALIESGSDIIELGIPFSDPLADGPTIQAASFKALQNGTTPEVCLEVAAKIRQKYDTPLIFMGYYNPIFHYGLERFCADCARVGIDGFIVPDLPPEEASELEGFTQKYGIDVIYLLAPTSDATRIEVVTARASGFIYLVSLTGVTGARAELPKELENFVNRVRGRTNLPLCVGFGISTPEQAKRVASVADGVIVGSKVIQLIEEDESLGKLKDFIRGLREAL